MARHLIDHPNTRGETARMKHYLRLKKAERPSAATKTLQRRGRNGAATARMRAFLRIARDA